KLPSGKIGWVKIEFLSISAIAPLVASSAHRKVARSESRESKGSGRNHHAKQVAASEEKKRRRRQVARKNDKHQRRSHVARAKTRHQPRHYAIRGRHSRPEAEAPAADSDV